MISVSLSLSLSLYIYIFVLHRLLSAESNSSCFSLSDPFLVLVDCARRSTCLKLLAACIVLSGVFQMLWTCLGGGSGKVVEGERPQVRYRFHALALSSRVPWVPSIHGSFNQM